MAAPENGWLCSVDCIVNNVNCSVSDKGFRGALHSWRADFVTVNLRNEPTRSGCEHFVYQTPENGLLIPGHTAVRYLHFGMHVADDGP